jgi:hypothetical protein
VKRSAFIQAAIAAVFVRPFPTNARKHSVNVTIPGKIARAKAMPINVTIHGAPGVLRWAPPGWDGSGDPTLATSYPGYTAVNVSSPETNLGLSSGVDYFVKITAPLISVADGTTSARTYTLSLSGGRNIVVVGGEIGVTRVNNQDDQVAIIVDGGDPTGQVHLEGLHIDAVNGITHRSPRQVTIQNCWVYVRAYNDDPTNVHADIFQTWDMSAPTDRKGGVRIHKMTGYSSWTSFTQATTNNLLINQPAFVTAYDVAWSGNHPSYTAFGVNGISVMNMRWLGYPTECNWTGRNLYYDTGWYSSSGKRELGDSLIQFGNNDQFYAGSPANAQFEIWRGGLPTWDGGSGTKIYSSAANPAGNTAPGNDGLLDGDVITYEQIPDLADHYWIQGPPAQLPVEEATVGMSYVSPGYL